MSVQSSAPGKVAYHIVAAVLASGAGAASEVSRKHLDRSQGTPAHPCALGQAGVAPALHPVNNKTPYRLAARPEGRATDKEEDKLREGNSTMGRKK
jgi:hypothetical protein